MTIPVTSSAKRLAPQLAGLTFARIMLNGMRRFPYLILTPMASALGVSRATLEQVLALQWLLSLLSPLAGPIIDRGRRRVMLFALVLLTVGATFAALFPGIGFVGAALLMGGAAKILYDPAMQAYIGDHVPYTRRAMALGVSELAWSGSLITFGPLAAFLIERVSLQAIFGAVALGGAVGTVVLFAVLPTEPADPISTARDRVKMQDALKMLLGNRSAIAIIAAITLVALAGDLFIIVYENWLITRFGITTLTLGSFSWGFAVAEMAGEFVIITLADRFGKKRLAVLSAILTGLAFLLVQFTVGNLPFALGVLFVLFLVFEVSTISLVPLASEVLPEARGIMLSGFWTGIALGRLLGSLIGGPLYRGAGFNANMVLAWPDRHRSWPAGLGLCAPARKPSRLTSREPVNPAK